MLSCSDFASSTREAESDFPDALNNRAELIDLEPEKLLVGANSGYTPAISSPRTLQGSAQLPQTQITASEGEARDYFGIDVAAGDNVIVVGTMVPRNKPGKAYIYREDKGTVTETILSGSSGHAHDRFGLSVDTDGVWVAVGAPDDDEKAPSAGAVYLFAWNGTDWIEKQKIVADDGAMHGSFGVDVAIHQNILVVGDHVSADAGAAYIFEYDGFNWNQVTKLVADDGVSADYFGSSVSIHDNTVVIGAYGDDDLGMNSGSAYVFEYENETWSQVTKLVPSDGDLGDNFGRALAIENDTIIVGAYADDDIAQNSGAVYRFKRRQIDFFTHKWEEDQKITASDGGRSEYFGCSVSISGDNVVIGAHQKNETELLAGAAYLFKPAPELDGSLVEMSKYIADTPQRMAKLGNAVDIHDDRIIAGALGVNDNGNNSGAVYAFLNEQSEMINRFNFNAYHTNTELLSASVHKRYMQQFVNNLDRIETIAFKIGGNVSVPYADSATVILRDGCGNEIARKVTALDTSGLVSETAWKWVYVDLDVDVEYGKYYYFELFTTWAAHSNGAKVVTNTNQYGWGKLISIERSNTFPHKKRDILFQISGKVNKRKQFYPIPETNIACPGRCRSVYKERNSYLAKQHFNVVIREERWHEDGSFWEDYTQNHLDELNDDIRLMLESDEGLSSRRGIKHVVPYNEYFPQMNFYLAVVDPENDDSLSYQLYCANSDADVKVVDDYPFGGWAFEGGILRRTMTDENWVLGDGYLGANHTLVHELFGHGIAYLDDEYTGRGGVSPIATSFRYNSDELGCPRWCAAHKDVYQVEGEVASACWSLDRESCQADNDCWYIGHDAIDYDISQYFHEKTCIPKNISRHNIGIDCEGNAGCYIGAPRGTSQNVYLNVAQPSGTAMMSMHGNAADGFTTPVENLIRTQINCMFPLSCHNYDFEACHSFQEQWGGMFGEYILGCEKLGNSVYVRRR